MENRKLIIVEGNIAAGKSTLCQDLATILNYGLLRYSRFAKYDIKDIPSIFQKLLNIAFYLRKEKISNR